MQTNDFRDIDGNHVGIDINGMISNVSKSAGYYDDNNTFRSLRLARSKAIRVWVEYDGKVKQMNVTMAPLMVSRRPVKHILSLSYDLSMVFHETMSVGFTAATGAVVSTQYVLGWSFKMNGVALDLDPSKLAKLPRIWPKGRPRILVIGVPIVSTVSFVVIFLGIVYYIGRKRKFAELLEDWELEFGPHRFKYKDLYYATKGFSEKELLGSVGFGMVYRGVLKSSNVEIVVKKVSHGSRQGMREFVAEIVSIGRLRHRNLVPLLGYCRRKGELILVYEYMPYGSLDKVMFDNPKPVTLGWNQRFGVIKGVASGLLYLHEEWEKLVIHRDVKASNVLLDGELNGRLGDFGLARLYDHGTDPQTTHLVGTIGYLAPEQTRAGKATTCTDVYAFGAFLLEVVCGRRPLDTQLEEDNDLILVDRVFSYWCRGEILKIVDSNLGGLCCRRSGASFEAWSSLLSIRAKVSAQYAAGCALFAGSSAFTRPLIAKNNIISSA
ncbi:PREDICTED: L-type lectin-domain containing receptor kinase IV.1-like [Ipomoea nil]|uniref:L-type lectin-domain containing receptor kinase IV.1-like n=1 Tax=Ipomoea nil TaxID=35883 RepID=UPI000900E493|nr:PREDICTED: L-type lectin-domain containing receptor kinase IV.1-like [Ipomoea nil]